ncbi:uncharacterized protein [Argopecten irradians]|uniref:uncharacterized protein n=1 Tax=Argopecten irradians TaxID=31199 RepID=UPI00371C35E2
MNAFLFVAFLNLAIFADATHDPILQSLQNQIVSLEQMVQQLSTDLTDLKQQHTHLQNKYRAVSDELNKLRTCESANQNQIHSLRSTTESVPEKPRRTLTKGQKGDKGDRGEQGLKGEAGTDGFNGDDGFDGKTKSFRRCCSCR